MALTFPTPPTFASPVVVNPQTGQNQFNPIWLQWFLVLAQFLETSNTGRLRDLIPTTSSGIYNPSNGTNNVLAFLWAGGGGGGTAAVTGAGQVSVGGGGGAGGFCWSLLSSGFSGILLTVGSGGLSASPGGDSTFAGLTARGGRPGQNGAALTGAGFTPGGLGGGSAGGIINGTGATGGQGIILSPTVAASGQGANSGIGGGALPVYTQGPGANAQEFSAGGSGGLNYASSATVQLGGEGSPGAAVIMELS